LEDTVKVENCNRSMLSLMLLSLKHTYVQSNRKVWVYTDSPDSPTNLAHVSGYGTLRLRN
jgi:hypothetical protein